MKAWQWHWPVVLLAAATILPAGLRAQQAPPAPPAPPEPPLWIGQTAPHNLGQLLSAPSAEEGWLGVTISEVSDAEARQAKLPQPAGVYVNTVQAKSPAANAGLKPRDIIVEYKGRAVEGVLQFRRLVRETPPGRSVSMRVWRDGRRQSLTAKVESRHMLFESALPELRGRIHIERPLVVIRGLGMHPLLGVRAEEVRGQLARYFQAPNDRGVLVVEVNDGSPAQKAGLKAGDVIYQVEGRPVATTVELEQALRQSCSAKGVSLGIVRKGVTLQLRVAIECPPGTTPAGAVSAIR